MPTGPGWSESLWCRPDCFIVCYASSTRLRIGSIFRLRRSTSVANSRSLEFGLSRIYSSTAIVASYSIPNLTARSTSYFFIVSKNSLAYVGLIFATLEFEIWFFKAFSGLLVTIACWGIEDFTLSFQAGLTFYFSFVGTLSRSSFRLLSLSSWLLFCVASFVRASFSYANFAIYS